jgi:hypothetical protein
MERITKPRIFEIKQFNKENFYSKLSNSELSHEEVKSHPHAVYLLTYLRKIEAKIIVVELDYTDIDYLDDYSNYYSTCYSKYPRSCKRIHFFSEKISRNELLQMLTGEQSESVKTISDKITASYLGFIVVRPLPKAIIGRTILKTYKEAVDNGDVRIYPCTESYYTNLFGLGLEIKNSLPFQQQDTAVAACATVSMWCTFHKVSGLFKTAIPRPSAITKAAISSLNSRRGFPSKGLNTEQMCKAITHFGLEPEVMTITGNQDLPIISLIYGYLKMGLPVILGCDVAKRNNKEFPGKINGQHAITLVGYRKSLKRYHQTERLTVSSADTIRMVGLRINRFYAHDDQNGPFSKLDIKFFEESINDNEYNYHPIAVESKYNGYREGILTFYPSVLIVPTYGKIRMSFTDIYAWVKHLNELIVQVLRVDHNSLEWEIFLTTTNELKKDICKKVDFYISSDNSLNSCHAKGLRNKLQEVMLHNHPRFIWRSSLNYIMPDGSRYSIDVLADATGVPNAFPIYDIIWFDVKTKRNITKALSTLENNEILELVGKEKLKIFLKNNLEIH